MLVFHLVADEEETHDLIFGHEPTPWFTGPLIAPSAQVVKKGHFTLQPYFNFFVDVGRYDAHWRAHAVDNFYNSNSRIRVRVGLTTWMDLVFIPQLLYKETKGAHSIGFGDLPVGINVQFLTQKLHTPIPSIKLALFANIPSGKYQHLNPHRKKTDAMGSGCWYPEIALVISKLWHLSTIHYLEARLFSGYRIGTPTPVRGFNVYGGGESTRGSAYPGNIFFLDGAIQYNLSINWALACDIYYTHRNHNRFSGNPKDTKRQPSSEQFSLAPAIEYNWSKNLGLIGGIWFSFAGRNTPQFINGILSLNAYF